MFAKDVFAFVEEVDRADDPDSVVRNLHRALATFGFETLLIGKVTAPGRQLQEGILVQEIPAEWARLYTERDYTASDPVLRRLRRSVMPFAFGEATFNAAADPRAAEVMRRRWDFGLRAGLVVPIAGRSGNSFVSVAGERVELTHARRSATHLMSLYAFNRLDDLLSPHARAATVLTAREREVLTWAAAGKTAWEIGEILSIAKRTVDEHTRNAARKLGAVNRTQAVALALRDRLIGA